MVPRAGLLALASSAPAPERSHLYCVLGESDPRPPPVLPNCSLGVSALSPAVWESSSSSVFFDWLGFFAAPAQCLVRP